MLRIGLTGGMGCGKSTVGQMMAKRGAHFIEADRVAHELMQPGTPVYQEIVRRFGKDVLNPDGTINRSRLAEAAFGAPGGSRIAELNAIVHPGVLAQQNRWMQRLAASDPNGVAVVEAALLLEAGAAGDFDKIIAVTCNPAQKAARVAGRLGLSDAAARAELERRTTAQWSDDKKAAAADYRIDNSGSLADTERQVQKLWEKLRTLAESAV